MEHSPNAVLKRLRDLMSKQTRQGAPAVAPWSAADTNELVTHLFDLDEYLTSGGVLPDSWDTAIRPQDAEEIRGLTARKLANALKKRGLPVGKTTDLVITIGDLRYVHLEPDGTATACCVGGPDKLRKMKPRTFISELESDLEALATLFDPAKD